MNLYLIDGYSVSDENHFWLSSSISRIVRALFQIILHILGSTQYKLVDTETATSYDNRGDLARTKPYEDLCVS